MMKSNGKEKVKAILIYPLWLVYALKVSYIIHMFLYRNNVPNLERDRLFRVAAIGRFVIMMIPL